MGGGAREHSIVEALRKSGEKIFSVMKNRNPGIVRASQDFVLMEETEVDGVAEWAVKHNVDWAIIGPEAPLGEGIVDKLDHYGIPTFGPDKYAAKLETNKEFCRNIMKKYSIPGLVDFWAFDNLDDLRAFLRDYGGDIVVKPLGLTGGKGVKVMGEHLFSEKDIIDYARAILEKRIGGHSRFLIEEKVVGEEFSLQAFVDGKRVCPMPAVVDHKRAYEGDKGPNTGGMGSYSLQDGLTPFMRREEMEEATSIMQKTVDAMRSEGHPFRGVLYGGFILTKDGPKILEYNVRFGDPEAMNVLPILEDDFAEICRSAIDGELPDTVAFSKKATVCKYVTPVGYGTKPLAGERVYVDEEAIRQVGARLFYASVNEKKGQIYTTTSRALAVVGIEENIEKAERISESALRYVDGNVFMRHDIGTRPAVEKRIKRMEAIRRGE